MFHALGAPVRHLPITPDKVLKALAQMLEQPKWGKITTAALAEKLDVSEAALYRHFASKAQMYEGLIEFIESSVFTLANKIAADEPDGRRQADKLLEMLLAFAEKNPGMVRVMTGDALVGEHERLLQPDALLTAEQIAVRTVDLAEIQLAGGLGQIRPERLVPEQRLMMQRPTVTRRAGNALGLQRLDDRRARCG